MIYCFGDSWGYGSELNLDTEVPFVNLISQTTKIPFKNYSTQARSFSSITHDILTNSEIKENDFIIVIIPPDTRWYFENNGSWHPLWLTDDKTMKNWSPIIKQHFKHYRETLPYKKEWFSYHLTIFLLVLQHYFVSKNIDFLFVHNYGKLTLEKNIEFLIDKNNFLNFEKSLTSLLGGIDDNLILENKDGPTTNMFIGEYFEGCGTHPNQKGHKKISELIINSPNFQSYLKKNGKLL